jgi:hypothetical protein
MLIAARRARSFISSMEVGAVVDGVVILVVLVVVVVLGLGWGVLVLGGGVAIVLVVIGSRIRS